MRGAGAPEAGREGGADLPLGRAGAALGPRRRDEPGGASAPRPPPAGSLPPAAGSLRSQRCRGSEAATAVTPSSPPFSSVCPSVHLSFGLSPPRSMAGVSFSGHRLELLAAYEEVIREESAADW